MSIKSYLISQNLKFEHPMDPIQVCAKYLYNKIKQNVEIVKKQNIQQLKESQHNQVIGEFQDLGFQHFNHIYSKEIIEQEESDEDEQMHKNENFISYVLLNSSQKQINISDSLQHIDDVEKDGNIQEINNQYSAKQKSEDISNTSESITNFKVEIECDDKIKNESQSEILKLQKKNGIFNPYMILDEKNYLQGIDDDIKELVQKMPSEKDIYNFLNQIYINEQFTEEMIIWSVYLIDKFLSKFNEDQQQHKGLLKNTSHSIVNLFKNQKTEIMQNGNNQQVQINQNQKPLKRRKYLNLFLSPFKLNEQKKEKQNQGNDVKFSRKDARYQSTLNLGLQEQSFQDLGQALDEKINVYHDTHSEFEFNRQQQQNVNCFELENKSINSQRSDRVRKISYFKLKNQALSYSMPYINDKEVIKQKLDQEPFLLPTTFRPLLTVSTFLVQKFLNDKFSSTKRFLQFYPLYSQNDLIKMELCFLYYLDYKIFIEEKHILKFYEQLFNGMVKKEQQNPKNTEFQINSLEDEKLESLRKIRVSQDYIKNQEYQQMQQNGAQQPCSISQFLTDDSFKLSFHQFVEPNSNFDNNSRNDQINKHKNNKNSNFGEKFEWYNESDQSMEIEN